MADSLQTLLTYIVDQPLMQGERKEAELDATAVQDVPAEVTAIGEENRREAERLGPSFAEGLRMAAQANGTVTVDDTDPRGNSIADAFARFLVTTNLATSQSATVSEGHYRYTFQVDMARLHQLAQAAGVNLDAALRGAS